MCVNVVMNECYATMVINIKKLGLSIDSKAEIPIYVQLKNQLRYLIQNRILKPGEQLPTVRELAVELSITANTVARVYTELAAEGIIELLQGKGTFVAEYPETSKKKDKIIEAESILAGAVKTLRGLGLSDFEIRDLLVEVSENITQF